MDFTSIFDGKALTLEEFQAKTKDMKLADLSDGEYVAKGKFEDQQKKIGELEPVELPNCAKRPIAVGRYVPDDCHDVTLEAAISCDIHS